MEEKRVVNIGIIGCGYWGPNYIRVFNRLKESRILCCCDLDKKNLIKIKKVYPDTKLTKDYKIIARDSRIDAVVITTPHNSHYEIAKACLENGKHILIEKPFTSSSKEAMDLIKSSEKNRLILMVGHIYEYNPGVTKLKEIIKEGKLGNIYYIHSERVGLGPIRKYANALWDLATHDISIALYLLDEFPEQISAVGEYYIQKNVNDMVFLSLKFPSRAIYNIYASWIAPEKIRKTTVVGSKCMAIFDDVNKFKMLKVYKRTINKDLLDSTPKYSDHQLIINIGGVYLPKIEHSEPMKNEAKHFLECISNNRKPLTDGRNGLKVIKILEAAEKSLKYKRFVDVKL